MHHGTLWRLKMKTQQYLARLNKFNKERKRWLILSSVAVISIIGAVIDWHQIEQYRLEWILSGIGLTIAIVWWYWTMRVIRYLIDFKVKEHELLLEVVTDIRSIKQEIINQKD